MARSLKIAVFRLARAAGLFALARAITRHRLRILAYHGFAEGDELRFRPKLFISAATFEARLSLLKRRGFAVRGLDEAVHDLRRGVVRPDTVVITIDDGYASTRSIAAPALARHGFAATVYVTTYHVASQTPVFDLVVAYMLWKTEDGMLLLHWPPEVAQPLSLSLEGADARERAAAAVIMLGRRVQGEPGRVALCRALGEAVGVPYDAVVQRDTFRLMNARELAALGDFGVAVGLHTHRHTFPADDLGRCRHEIQDNEAHLRPLLAQLQRHFCYPSGEYSPAHWALLEDMGIASSTTCDTGLARPGDAPHALKRFLDGEMVSEVEFDAEVCGFAELLRQMLGVKRQQALT